MLDEVKESGLVQEVQAESYQELVFCSESSP